jgi:hypothetical protein
VIALVGCGKAKLDHEAPAGQLYTGSCFRACYAAAQVVAPGRVFILSALYDALAPSQPILPCDLTLGQPGSVTAREVELTAMAHGVHREPVVALCGSRYTNLARQVWAHVDTPLAGLGIGRQLHELSRIANPQPGRRP